MILGFELSVQDQRNQWEITKNLKEQELSFYPQTGDTHNRAIRKSISTYSENCHNLNRAGQLNETSQVSFAHQNVC